MRNAHAIEKTDAAITIEWQGGDVEAGQEERVAGGLATHELRENGRGANHRDSNRRAGWRRALHRGGAQDE